MKLDDSQKKQFIVLCCLVLFVLGFGVYRVIGTSAAPVTEKQEQKAAENETASEPESEAKVEQPSSGAWNVYIATQEARDPFIPQMTPKPPQPGTSGAAVREIPAPMPKFPPLPIAVNPFGWGEGMPSVEPTAQPEPEPDPSKELRITGVLQGKSRLAIIRGQNGTRYIVREGQRIDGKYVVEEISSSGVWLSFENRKFFLRLGGSDSGENRTR